MNLSGGCFGWLSEWRACPTQTVAPLCGLYEVITRKTVYEPEGSHKFYVRLRLCVDPAD